MEKLSDLDWISLGLGSNMVKFEPMKPICQLWDLALTVYFIAEGNISVVTERRNKYNQEIIDEFQVAVLKPETGFGEPSVLYGETRTASCVALDDVYCISIDHKIF